MVELLNTIGSKIPIVSKLNKLEWKHDVDRYNVKSFTQIASKELYEAKLNKAMADFIWQGKSPPRAELLL